MRHLLASLLILFLATGTLRSETTLTETQKLAATCKVWGFLKYYHPNVAKGKFDWDQELFSILKKVDEVNDNHQLSAVFLNWIESLGKVKSCKKCAQNTVGKDYFGKNFNLSWMDDRTVFTRELANHLRYIEKNRNQGKNVYVSTVRWVENVRLQEDNYKTDFFWSNQNYRMLTLFRYWNVIEYFFPYKYQTDVPWDTVLETMIPKFRYAPTETSYHLAMLKLISNINDSHAFNFTAQQVSYFGIYWIPYRYSYSKGNIVITGCYNDSLCRLNGLKKGDIITKVDGRTIKEIYDERQEYIPASTPARKNYISYYAILNGQRRSAKIEYMRDGKTYSTTVDRYLFRDFNYEEPSLPQFTILDNNVGYLNLHNIERKEINDIMDSLLDTKALIIDIRRGPKNTLFHIAKYISSNDTSFYNVIRPDIHYPGRFYKDTGTFCGNKNGELKYKGKVILLVNYITQSHSEFTTMCLQTGDNVTTVGSQTSGADGNVSYIPLPGGYKTSFSGIGIFYPDWRETQRVGVDIDIEVEPSYGYETRFVGDDKLLKKALEIANE